VTIYFTMKEKSALRIFLGNTYYSVTGTLKNIVLAIFLYTYNDFLTNFPSYALRSFYLRNILKIKIGKDTAIHMGCFFAGKNIEIGNNTVIARNCYLDGRAGKITIGNNVSISPEVYILSLTHEKDSPSFATISKPVLMEDYCWIGVRALILPGIVLQRGAVIGAGSVVVNSVEPFNVAAGNPAKIIGKRSDDLHYTLKYFPLFNTDI
jgi:acetyltransferase-like isoleucine patch superfamily enzyme